MTFSCASCTFCTLHLACGISNQMLYYVAHLHVRLHSVLDTPHVCLRHTIVGVITCYSFEVFITINSVFREQHHPKPHLPHVAWEACSAHPQTPNPPDRSLPITESTTLEIPPPAAPSYSPSPPLYPQPLASKLPPPHFPSTLPHAVRPPQTTQALANPLFC